MIGQTDRHGGVPVTEAYTPADLAATIFHLLGIGPDAEFHDAQGRPYRIYQGRRSRPLMTTIFPGQALPALPLLDRPAGSARKGYRARLEQHRSARPGRAPGKSVGFSPRMMRAMSAASST